MLKKRNELKCVVTDRKSGIGWDQQGAVGITPPLGQLIKTKPRKK